MSSGNRLPSIGRSLARRVGFTLIELIVVIAIIATLASLVAPSIFRNTGDAKVTAARAQIEMLGIALESFRLDLGVYPSSSQGLQALVIAPGGTGAAPWRGPYLKRQVPLDPWGHAYVYETRSGSRGTPDEYVVTSLGRDGKIGGEGEDGDISSGIGPRR